jgi:hypothetical protein
MAATATPPGTPSNQDLERMHALYMHGGRERRMAPQIVYSETTCPHENCDQPMHAIDFRQESYGPGVHDPLVKAWWDDVGFAGRCPRCGGWIHFTIRGKRPISAAEAAQLPQLPDDWHTAAMFL